MTDIKKYLVPENLTTPIISVAKIDVVPQARLPVARANYQPQPREVRTPEISEEDSDDEIATHSEEEVGVIPAEIIDFNEQQFWDIVHGFEWKNTSDGMVNGRNVETAIDRLSVMQTQQFKEIYWKLYNELDTNIKADGLFERYKIVSFNEQAKIVSHTIAMGMDVYLTLSNDMELLQFLVEAAECQSLHERLPATIRGQ
jgi:hypothetical protein